MIWFIISGFHNENFPDFVQNMYDLVSANTDDMDIFWSCHKEPSDLVKELFPNKWELFPNLGLEDGAYQQALDHLNEHMEPDNYIFFLHDDLTIKSFDFIKESIELIELRGKKFIGNGMNYPADVDLNKLIHIGGIKHTYSGNFWKFTKDETSNLFNPESYPTIIIGGFIFKNILTIRESFICTKKKYIDEIKQFEVIWEEPFPDENGKFHIGGMGNTQQTMLGFKICQILGPDSIAYLSTTYQDSEYIYEHARGIKD